MSQQPELPPIWRFGVFQLDVRAGELHKNGVKLKLQEQPFKVLCLLLEHPGELVSREEIRHQLWPADTFVDFDHGLNAAIKRLRDALGESADTPVFIETLARRGYRFIGPVEGRVAQSGIGVEAATEQSKLSFVRPWAAIAILLCVGIGALIWVLWRQPWRPKEIIERKLTTNSSENGVGSAGISPDGKYLAYTDNTGMYLKQVRTGETHPVSLPANFSGFVSDWFPDGSHLLVARQEQSGKLSLWSVSVFGGAPRQLADGGWGSVSPDGTHIAFQRFDHGPERWVMRSDGTQLVKVSVDNSSWVGEATWSPDGSRIAYVRTTVGFNGEPSVEKSSVEVNDWKNASAETLFSDNRLAPTVHWLPGNLLIYGLGDASDKWEVSLWMVALQPSGKIAGAPKRISRGTGWISQIKGSQDGKVLTFLRGKSVPSVYLGTLAQDGTHRLTVKRLTLDENENNPFAWTPDSKAVLFHSDRNGTPEIFKQGADQPLPERLMTSADRLVQPRLTPSGSEILYISNPESTGTNTPNSIFAVPIAGGVPRLVLQDVHIWNVQCARAPSTLCMYSITKGDNSETFRFDVHNGKSADPSQIDPDCSWDLSPDGSQRAIIPTGGNGTIRFRSTLTGKARELAVKGWNELDSVTWSADGSSLLVSWHHGSDTALLNVTLDGNVSVLLRSSNPQIIGAVPSPDGRFLAIAEVSGTQNAWQIDNFR
jgi:DNA-binding winged helix-turn-helix (wHTH) protein/Tol biopolymer transport system component